MSTSDDRLFKRKLNELDQDLRRIQREIQKLKMAKRGGAGGRGRKEMMRSLQREADIQEVFDTLGSEEFKEIQVATKTKRDGGPCCNKKECRSYDVTLIEAGMRVIVSCNECNGRYVLHSEDEIARLA